MDQDLLLTGLLLVILLLLLRDHAPSNADGVRVRTGPYGTQIDYATETRGGRCG